MAIIETMRAAMAITKLRQKSATQELEGGGREAGGREGMDGWSARPDKSEDEGCGG